ncbi:MAG: histidine phosphatase family protein [Spongiibacteraceae bacterium]
MGEIYLVRHGQASFGTDNYDRLSTVGADQAQHLGDYFRMRGLEFDRVVIGAMVRHRQTLECTGYTEVAPEIVDGLNEYDFHALVNCHVAQFPVQPPVNLKDAREFYRQLRITLGAWADGSLRTNDDCETWLAFETRVQKSLQALIAKADAKRVLVVSSGGAISALIREVLGLTVEQMIALNLQMANTGITRLMFKGDKVRLQSWNAVPHLETPNTQHLLSHT